MTNTATATRPAFRVLGTTDEVAECEHCGRVDLKGTVVLGILDADSNVEERVYFGAVCGAKAAGWTTKDIRKAAKTADQEAKMAAFYAGQAKLAAELGTELAAPSFR